MLLRLRFGLLLVLFGLAPGFSPSALAQPEMPVILSMRDRAGVVDAWLERRLETVVPALMRRAGIQMWIVSAREYTDTQQHAYVLRPGEASAPRGLRDALATGNRLQDILTGQFEAGRTGNDILKRTLDQARKDGIQATIYTHPIGFQGHGAGPTIGLWDQQDGVPGRGDYPLHPNTAYSIELNAAVPIPEWSDKVVRIMLEEDASFDGTGARYIDGRQTEPPLIPRP